MARAYAAFANGGKRIDGSIFGNRPRVVSRSTSTKNAPKPQQVISETNAEIVTSILQQVVQQGTGKRAQLPDGRPVAGKTGTTENYGDAWFVGYTPQLVVAVWVGYPNKLRADADRSSTATPSRAARSRRRSGKSFMETALPYLKDDPESFPAPSIPASRSRQLVLRDGTFQLDNGLCRNTITVAYFAGRAPAKTANCKPNEVEVPNVVGDVVRRRRARGWPPSR